jgi:sugar phosphate isomerase/epimerase
MKKISLGSWAFAFGPYASDPVPFDRTAKRLADAGYDAIEVCGIQEHVTLEAYPSKESREPVRKMLDDLGLARSGYACDQYAADPTEAASKEKYLDRFARNLELCNDLAIANIRVDTVAPPNKYSNAAEYESAKGRVAEVFNAAAQKAQEAGVKLHWEFEPGFLFNKPSEIVEIHEKTAHPNFSVMFDTSHAYMCAVIGARQPGRKESKETLAGGVGELLEKLDGRIGAIHLIDSDGTLHNDETSTHNPFGTGRVDFRSLTPKLLAVPGIDYWTIDMCFWAGSWELADASLAYVRNLLQRAEAPVGVA